MKSEEQLELSFMLKLAQIRDLEAEDKRAALDFIDSIFDAELTEQEWIDLYAYHQNKSWRK
jgi:hypothetical protein